MTHIRTMLATASLFLVTGAIDVTRADDDKAGVTLFTPRGRADHFICGAVNVSNKTLGIAFAILGDDGKLLVPSSGDPNPTEVFPVAPGAVAEIDISFTEPMPGPMDGYCEIAVSGTENRNDVRVALSANLTRTIPNAPGNIPVYVFSVLEGH
jgi:hypothetical protein